MSLTPRMIAKAATPGDQENRAAAVVTRCPEAERELDDPADELQPPDQLNSVNIGVTSTAGDRTFRFRDVGADLVQIKPDGTLVLLISGQVPFAFAGVLKINPETEEVILEPRDRSEEQLAKACKALTGS
jgi:hypothetical protein